MRCVIWDFDGTLAARSGMWSGALAESAAADGIVVGREVFSPYLQQGFPWHSPHVTRDVTDAQGWWRSLEPVLVRACVAGLRVDEALALAIARRVRHLYTQSDRWRVFDDVAACLTALSSAGWRHVILSNHVPELQDLVTAIGLGAYFDAVFSSGVTGIEKPNPLAYRLVRDYAGDGAELVMVGDSWDADICGAAAVGIGGVLVRKSHAAAKRCCHSLDGLPALLACT